MQDGFELVKRKRQRKKKVKFDYKNIETNCESDYIFNGKLNKALKEFESSQFCFELFQIIDNSITFIGLDVICEVFSYGLGNFTKSKSSLHQLAALIKINRKYNSSVIVYDPVFTSFEIDFLKKLNFIVLSENEEGKRKVTGEEITLVFLPHCPKQLTNNFLWANWNNSLCRCILISNSFSKIIQDNTKKVLQESAGYIVKIYPHTQEIFLKDCYHIENIFNDTSVHCFVSKNLNPDFFLETLETEPNYLQDTELITKSFNCLNIKDE